MLRSSKIFLTVCVVATVAACSSSESTAPVGDKPVPVPVDTTPTQVVAVKSVTVNVPLDTLEAYDIVNMQAITRDSANNVLTGRVVQWTTSNPAVATIDVLTGALTGVDRGTVTVTATSEGVSGVASRVVVIRYRSLSTGTAHACNLASGGIAWCWGLNGAQGRIGSATVGDNMYSATPVKVPGNNRFSQLSTYGVTTCGVRIDGKALCWGSNNWGALGVATTTSFSFTPVEVVGNHTFRSVSAGADHVCGLTTDFHIYCWGYNGWGQFGNSNTTANNIPQLSGNGGVFNSVTAGSSFTCAVTIANAGSCWGADGDGQQGNGLAISQGNTYNTAPRAMVGPVFASIDASASMACGLTATGDAYCWGSSTGGRLGSIGTATSTPRAVSGGYSFRNLSVGATHVCGVTQEYAVYCWGMNGNGQLGLTLTNGSTTPIRAGATLLAAEVSAANITTGSASYTCAESKDRLTTYCWGRNDVGQLGNAAITTDVAVNSSPTIVVGQKPL